MSLFRSTPSRIYYGENRTAVGWDEYATATAIAAGMLGIAWLCIVPTCKKKRTTILVNLSYAFSLFVFVVAVLGLVCKSWQSGTVYTSSLYSAYSPNEINGTVGLFVGLTSFNVTLVGAPEYQNMTVQGGVTRSEQINYNEVVDFGVRQGRSGYGQYANQVNQEYRSMQFRGMPFPISCAIELFINDGDGLRWGRIYRKAGYYAHILLWTSIPMWAITLTTLAAGLWGIRAGFADPTSTISSLSSTEQLSRTFLLKTQLRPTALLCMATGLLLLGAPVIYALVVRTSLNPVMIHFSLGDLELAYGWNWYLTLLTGFVVECLGVATYVWCTWNYQAGLKNIDEVWVKPLPIDPNLTDPNSTLSQPHRAISNSTSSNSSSSPPPKKLVSRFPPMVRATSPQSIPIQAHCVGINLKDPSPSVSQQSSSSASSSSSKSPMMVITQSPLPVHTYSFVPKPLITQSSPSAQSQTGGLGQRGTPSTVTHCSKPTSPPNTQVIPSAIEIGQGEIASPIQVHAVIRNDPLTISQFSSPLPVVKEHELDGTIVETHSNGGTPISTMDPPPPPVPVQVHLDQVAASASSTTAMDPSSEPPAAGYQ